MYNSEELNERLLIIKNSTIRKRLIREINILNEKKDTFDYLSLMNNKI